MRNKVKILMPTHSIIGTLDANSTSGLNNNNAYWNIGMLNFGTLLSILFMLLAACGQPTGDEDADTMDTSQTLLMEESQYDVSPAPPSTAYPDAVLQHMQYAGGRFTFDIVGDSYQLGVQTPDAPQKGCANSAQGQHIHLIVDKQPYAAKYEAEFEYAIEDGEHYILAFLSRSYHESIKTEHAYKVVKAVVKDGAFHSTTPVSEPMLFYSRPKGIYEGDDTKRILLDYYLLNCSEGNYTVKAEINGEEHMLTEWQPYFIEGLPAGENEITLTLLDSNGNPVDNPLNPVTRKIQVNPAPTENM